MITYVRGNLFESPAQVLVNTVNTEGVMGKGIALEFKNIYPEMFREYRRLCEDGKIGIGKLHLYRTSHKWILNFPTKETWRRPSKPEYIRAGLKAFVQVYAGTGIHSIAFPPLGCGNGELDFATQVRPLMEHYLKALPIDIFVYPEKPTKRPPEHRDQEAIRAWLRSEPEALPFDEVWVDVCQVIRESRVFRTVTGGTFRAKAVEEPPTLVVETANGRRSITRDELLEFWQQLRQYGFSYRSITPRSKTVSYLIPIFGRLDYVERVEVSKTSEGLARNAAVALQVNPPPRSAQTEGSLFENLAG